MMKVMDTAKKELRHPHVSLPPAMIHHGEHQDSIWKYILITFVFPPLAYFLLWRHKPAPLFLARYVLVNSSLFSILVITILASLTPIMHLLLTTVPGNTLIQEHTGRITLYMIASVLIALTGFIAGVYILKKEHKGHHFSPFIIDAIYIILFLEYVIGVLIMLYFNTISSRVIFEVTKSLPAF